MIHLGKWQDAQWPDEVDCIITDPPYSERTHSGNDGGRRETRDVKHPGASAPIRPLDYASLTAADVHAWFETFLVAESENMRDRLAIVARAARLHIAEAQASADRQRAKQEATVRVLEGRIGRLLDLHLSGSLPADEYAAKRRELDAALLSARSAEAAAGENRVSTEAAISTLVRLLSDPVKLWRAFPVASRAQFVRLLFGSTLSLARTGISRTGASACVCSVLRGADGAVGTMAPQSALSIESLATLCQCAAHAASLLASVA